MPFQFPDNKLDDYENALYYINATIYGDKKITEVYTSIFNELDINIPDNIIVKEFYPFTWICKKEDIIDMSVITFIWSHIDTTDGNCKRIHNQYFNGYMFGYSHEDIKAFYLQVYSDIEEARILEKFEKDKENLFSSIEYCKGLEEYKNWIKEHFPEID